MDKNDGSYRRADFKEPLAGSYVTVYQHPGESAMLDVQFFNGDRTLDEAIFLKRLLDKAIEKAREWSEE